MDIIGTTLAEAPAGSGAAAERSYMQALLAHGLLIETGVDGVYGRSEIFEDVVERISDLIGAWGIAQHAELLRFPPAMNAATLAQSGYLGNFPQLAGSIYSFCGDDGDHQRLLRCLDPEAAWEQAQQPTRLAMTPVACYPAYPAMAARGPLPREGRTLDIFSYCFRHEPSSRPERMQLFRQREFVRMGTPSQIVAFRQEWMDHAERLFDALGLPATIAVANDPFFGRTGKVMADSQRSQQLKFELLVPLIDPDKPTACGSFNYHRDRFSQLWKILDADGNIAHTGCCGFGLERVALSLFKMHGFDVPRWPESVRHLLWNTEHRRAPAALRHISG